MFPTVVENVARLPTCVVVPVGTTDGYAVGVSACDHDFSGSLNVVENEDVNRRSATLARRSVPATRPGLNPILSRSPRYAVPTITGDS